MIGGDAGVKYQNLDAQMAGDLVAMARPVTKWATMVTDPSSVLRVLRRAIKLAATPPMGPVYVCLPQDVLATVNSETVRPTSVASTRVVPQDLSLAAAAETLAAAEKPMFFIGDGIAYSGAQDELALIAELVGAEVWEADTGELNIDHRHPLYQGATGHMFGAQSKLITQRGDVNLICGTYVLPEVFPELGDIFAPHSKVIHIDLNAYEIAKNHAVAFGFVSDPKLTLARLVTLLKSTMTSEQRAKAAQRTQAIQHAGQERRNAEIDADKAKRSQMPMQFSTFMADLASRLPSDVILFDEALTNSPAVNRYASPHLPGHYFLSRGGSLGVGIPGAIGAKLAHPDKMVIGFTGDGAAMYTIQALWTAARHNIGAKFVVCNNRSYRLLQLNILQYWDEQGIAKHDFPPSFDLSQPPLRFDLLARAHSIPGVRIETPEQIHPALDEALGTPGPYLIDVVVEGDVHPALIGVRCGQ